MTEVLLARTKAEIEEKGTQAVSLISQWCSSVKLELAVEKTVLYQLRGSLNMRSPPIIRLDGRTIRGEENPKYLGCLQGKDFNPAAHITIAKYGSIRPVTRVQWGVTYWSRRIMYKALFETVALYACPAWTS